MGIHYWVMATCDPIAQQQSALCSQTELNSVLKFVTTTLCSTKLCCEIMWTMYHVTPTFAADKLLDTFVQMNQQIHTFQGRPK